jgi:hypothetical protein
MISYVFFLAALATASELPTTDITPAEQAAVQELVTMLTVEESAPMISEESADTAVAENAIPQAQPIIITNAIEPHMLEYKHWTGKYSPELFTVSVNGTEVQCGSACDIPADANTVEIEYNYSFMNGMRTGGKKISYQLHESIAQASITFDWKNDWRIILDNGKALKEITS